MNESSKISISMYGTLDSVIGSLVSIFIFQPGRAVPYKPKLGSAHGLELQHMYRLSTITRAFSSSAMTAMSSPAGPAAANKFVKFVNASPTPFHAVRNAALKLEKAGFVKVC